MIEPRPRVSVGLPVFNGEAYLEQAVISILGQALVDLELIISLKDTLGGSDGGVQIWDFEGSRTNCLMWPTGRGNYLRQGHYPH